MSIFKDDILSDQVALITGGGSGIYKSITRAPRKTCALASRFGTSAEVGDATAFLASEAAAYMSGSIMVVGSGA